VAHVGVEQQVNFHGKIVKDRFMDSAPRKKKNRPNRSATARWGNRPSLFDEGFLVVPHRFLRSYASLQPNPLTPGEALFVLQLMTFKWDEADPYPSYTTLAQRMGVTPKMVRRYAQGLQRKGYLLRKFQSKAPNKFDLSGLFAALQWLDYRKKHSEDEGGEKMEAVWV
jgi:hypothetical protein